MVENTDYVWNDRKERFSCPYGHKFGKHTDKFLDCNKCAIWEDCVDHKER